MYALLYYIMTILVFFPARFVASLTTGARNSGSSLTPGAINSGSISHKYLSKKRARSNMNGGLQGC